jgi:hypothetical protein
MTFNPNEISLKEGLERIEKMQAELGLDKRRIFTSRGVGNLYKNPLSAVTNVPSGFTKIMLPFSTSKEATFYISSGAPNTHVPSHSHEEGEGIRFIISGSIVYEGQELTQGDWMYIPPKTPYSFDVGPAGCTICYCYCCCCAPRLN